MAILEAVAMRNWKWMAAFALVIVAMLAGFALADGDFVVTDGVLTGYNGADTEIVIPNDLGITEIGANAFANKRNVTSVTVPEGVTAIGERAFYYCSAGSPR